MHPHALWATERGAGHGKFGRLQRMGPDSGVLATPTQYVSRRICDVSSGMKALADLIEPAL